MGSIGLCHRTGGVETLWALDEWKRDSNKGLPTCSAQLKIVDDALAACHSASPMFVDRLACSVTLMCAIHAFYTTKPDSQRMQPLLQLANQLAQIMTPRTPTPV